MKNRFTAFAAALLLLPPFALTLAGVEWQPPYALEGGLWLPALLTTLIVLVLMFVLDAHTFHRNKHSLLRSQRGYLLWNALAGMAAGALLGWLNLFAASWYTAAPSATAALLLAAMAGLLLQPFILILRLWLAGLPLLQHIGNRAWALPALETESVARLLLGISLFGLIAGPVWMDRLSSLFWLAPLLLLAALQLLWQESTVFTGLTEGKWNRVLLGMLAGNLAGGIALFAYRLFGGALAHTAHTVQLMFGFALLGLFTLQLSDILAEHWRGKSRGELFKKKPFPIPVVTKKDQ